MQDGPKMTRISWWLGVLSMFVVGCANCRPDRNPEPTQVPVPQAVPRLIYDAHEWGLIDFHPGLGLDVVGGPLNSNPPNNFRQGVDLAKPVVYFHRVSDNAENDAHVVVSVRIPAGRLLEVWPGDLNGVSEQSFQFAPFALASPARQCPVDAASTRLLCTARTAADGYCERSELHRYVSADANCLTLGNGAVPFLFYRGDIRDVTQVPLPASIMGPVQSDGRIIPWPLVTGESADWFLVRIDSGRLRYSEGTFGDGDTLRPPTDEFVRERVLARLTQGLRAQGMTEGETESFLNGWADEIAGTPAQIPDESPELAAAERPHDLLYFWAPTAWLDRHVARVDMRPSPRQFRRAILVRVRYFLDGPDSLANPVRRGPRDNWPGDYLIQTKKPSAASSRSVSS